MKIEVTKEDIQLGRKNCSHFCPIAYATARAFPDRLVIVGKDDLYMKDFASRGDRQWFHELPHDAKQFIDDFDHGIPVEPFTFNIPNGLS